MPSKTPSLDTIFCGAIDLAGYHRQQLPRQLCLEGQRGWHLCLPRTLELETREMVCLSPDSRQPPVNPGC